MDNDSITSKIHNYALEEIMGERFGRYSKYIIQDRAIPDVRDGLKPVQRRIIFAMYRDKNTYDKQFKKCANAVGNVMGKFHPHGDSSIYEALVRMSQEWKQNHILVSVDGNNGSIDGDGPAAMRYTECRLAKISEELLKDIDKDTVNMAWNYSDTLKEPTVLPAKFPNLLVNGSSGISAGYATNIPPHNLSEVIDATIKRIDSPNCKFDSIMEIIKGPDFPTGGVVEGIEDIKRAFKTGKGKVVVKAKYEFVKNKGKEQIIITEIPFEVNKQELVKKIDDIRLDKKIDGIAEVRDESDKDDFVRIAIDLKAGADKDLVINYLLKNTQLQCNYAYNMVVIANRRPKLLGIVEILDAYIDHLKDVIKKRSAFDLEVARKELHISEGLIKALSILDEVIATIRASKNKADAKVNLQNKYGFTENQAEAIVVLQLYKLTNTDVVELEEKVKNLLRIIAGLEEILASEAKLNIVAKDELRKIKKEYGRERRTEIKEEITEISISAEDLIVKENVMVVLTKQGYIKKVPMKSYSAANGDETALKPGDYVLNIYETNTINKIAIFTKLGNYIYIPVNDIPWSKWKDLGKHVSNLVTLDPNDEVLTSYIVTNQTEDNNIIFVTKDGMVKRSPLSSFIVSRYTKAYTAMKLKENDYITNISLEKENVILVTKSGYYISYKAKEIPLVTTKSGGVKGINLKDDEVIAGLSYDDSSEFINIFTNKCTAKRIRITDLSQLSRAKRGSTLIKKVKTNPYNIINALVTTTKDKIGLTYLEDIGILKNTDISILDLESTGSSIAKKQFINSFVFTNIEKIEEDKPNGKKKNKSKEEEHQEELEFLDSFKI